MVGHGPLRALLAPLFAALDALLRAMYGDVGWHLLAATRGRLLSSLGLVKHYRFVADIVRGGDVTRLLKCVPEEVAMSALV
jgi:hypothetical protein